MEILRSLAEGNLAGRILAEEGRADEISDYQIAAVEGSSRTPGYE
jgi:hypothetical protein